jgi:hypothetical protein
VIFPGKEDNYNGLETIHVKVLGRNNSTQGRESLEHWFSNLTSKLYSLGMLVTAVSNSYINATSKCHFLSFQLKLEKTEYAHSSFCPPSLHRKLSMP